MGRADGDTIVIWQGENPDIQFNVVDDDNLPYDLTDGEAVLTYWQGTASVDVDGVIATTTVTISLSHAVTQLLSGMYEFQLFCKNSAGKIVMTKQGLIQVNTSKNPDAVS
jgi:hypothetical protein